MLNSGIPFTKKPIAIQFDYKVKMSDREKRIRATGFSRITDVEGKDFPEVNLFLQKRWEDEKGNIYAKRVGTMVVRYYTTTDCIIMPLIPSCTVISPVTLRTRPT
mgnify:FL=1